MSVPHSLEEVVDEESAWEWFCEVVRNLSVDLIKKIQNSQIASAECENDSKLRTACAAWNRYLVYTGGVITLPDQAVHIPA